MMPAGEIQPSAPSPAKTTSLAGAVSLSRLLTVLLILTYVGLFHLIYSLQISPSFAYMGYTLNPAISQEQWLVMALFVILPSLFLRLDGRRPSNFIILLLYVLVYVPAQYMFTVLNLTFHGVLLNRAMLLLGMAIITAVSARPLSIGFDRSVSIGVFRAVLMLVFGVLFLVVASQFGFRLNLVNILDVYDIRSDYKDEIGEAGLAFAYAVPYLGVVSAFMVGYGLVKRFIPFLLMGSLSLLYIFGTTGQKSMLFSVLLLIGVSLLYRINIQKLGQNLVLSMIVFLIAVFGFDLWSGGILASSLFVRRLILTPGLLTTYYMDFFSVNPPAQLGHSFLSDIFPYPYDLRPAYLIGREYFNSPSMSANANMFADSYSNFRELGIIGFSIVLGAILSLVDGYSRRSSSPVVVVVGMALPAFALTNSALFTSLVTHGMIFAIVLTYLYCSTEK
ncbi:hypothetical protein QOL99_02440 [Deinococcus sp. MIMF12]|uniref:Oligosaccharide repeat unit polymerase n=1 Tax=Deinococcus rhizophilus TaxID=3049544 RepID=A0ABT7JD69_9DEIO|nr:hypothetical protein [Deinococcus rhizophilus]MDL2343003.1 hypothetical protein [Deinococcus rhizophilus]